jgi:hypothetical protein
MATRFDPKAYAIREFMVLANKYFPSDHLRVSSGKKGFRLTDSTLDLINKVKKVISQAQEMAEVVPQSTAVLYRYGVAFQKIFENLRPYQTISFVKSRSRRGYRKEMEYLAFDLKKIELELKKSSNPPVKTQKDEKYLRDIRKHYFQLIHQAAFQELESDINVKKSFFVLEDSEGYKFFDAVFRHITSFNQKINAMDLLTNQKDELTNSLDSLKQKINEFKAFRKKNEVIIRNYKTKQGVYNRIERKETLITDPDVSLFLKIMTTSLERYIKMMERREKQKLERRDNFLGLIFEPTKYSGLDEDLWKEIVFIIETHGIELLVGKNWFNFSFADELRHFITRKDILTKFAELRSLESELEKIDNDLNEIPEYNQAVSQIQELEKLKGEMAETEKKMPEFNLEITRLEEEIKEERESLIRILS